jgi:excisionase family DNA binding protein
MRLSISARERQRRERQRLASQGASSNGELSPLVTSAQLARHLQISTRTLVTMRQDGSIPFYQPHARLIRYRISDVEKALAK